MPVDLVGAFVTMLFDDSRLAVAVLDRELRFWRVSDALAAMNGVPAAEHVGKKLRDVVPGVADIEEKLFEEVAQTGKPLLGSRLTGRTPASDRERHWDVDYYPLLDAGDVIGFAATAVELTDLVEVQDSLSAQTSEVYETVVQSLTAAKIALELGDKDDVVRHELDIAIASARRVASVGLAAKVAGSGRVGAPDIHAVDASPGAAGIIRAVVADDDAMIRRLMTTALRRAGTFDVVAEATDGREAVEAVTRTQPDLVVLDINMPVLNGLDALPHLRTAAPAARLVVMSGLDDPGVRALVHRHGAFDYIDKGTPIKEVITRLERAARDTHPTTPVAW
jgi:CheY-like chemotaxis protein